MKTKSEQLFQRYCGLVRYTCEPIPEKLNSRTPDYFLFGGNEKVVIEIKELSPNDDDKRRANELKVNRYTSSEIRPGRRIYNAITDGASQLKQYEHKRIPCVLVIYDNIVIDGVRPWIVSPLLELSSLDFGMYGLQTVTLSKSKPRYYDSDIHVDGVSRGGDRRMTNDMKNYISAVSVLCEDDNEGDPYLYTFHNWFAKVPLPKNLFRGSKDKHFAKPDHPDICPQIWNEI